MNGNITMNNCTFRGNTATGDGGAINFQNDKQYGTYIYMNNCTFDKNSANKWGGAIVAYRTANTFFDRCIITNNHANTEGGFIRYSADTQISNSYVANNTSDHDGGAFYAGQTYTFTAYNTTFYNNNAKRWGGVVNGRSLQIDYCVFEQNYVNVDAYDASDKFSTARGGALFSREGTCIISSSNFTGNLAQEGGAICIEERSNSLTIGNCNFYNNNATIRGGGVYSDAKSMSAVTGGNFENNTAMYGGAAYFGYVSEKGQVSVSLAQFKYNKASIQGGAVYMNIDGAEIVNSQFYYNEAPFGGAIYWNGENGKIQGSQFLSNDGVNGSSVYWRANNGNLANSNFKDVNPSTGSVYWHGSNGVLTSNGFNGVKGVYVCNHASDVSFVSNTQYSSSISDYSVYIDGTASLIQTILKMRFIIGDLSLLQLI